MTRDAHGEPGTTPPRRQERKKTSRSQPNQLLRQARQERCWSQADLAERIGVTNETISRWENGVNMPHPEQLKRLCEAFDKMPSELGYPPGPASLKREDAVEIPRSSVELDSIKQELSRPRQRWSRVIIGGMSGLLIILLILGVVRFAPSVLSTSCGGTFFDGTLGSGWEWINPSGKATYRVTPAGLTLSVPADSDLNAMYNFDAPRLLRPITGDFTIETRLVFRPQRNFQSAGIVLWQDSTTYLRFERGFGLERGGVLLQEWDHGETPIMITSFKQNPTTAGSVELRIQRQADHLTASWREPGQRWKPGGDTLLHFDRLSIGIDLIDDFNTLQITSASYNYFRILCS